MYPPPSKASVQLVASVTGLDLSGLDRRQFIARVEGLLQEEEQLDPVLSAGAKGQVLVTMGSLGSSWVLRAVLKTEQNLLLN